jgi:exopolysaccharide biosynthesis polyprenyl glycosylphosphotransferase
VESSAVDHPERAHGEAHGESVPGSLSLGPQTERSRPRDRGIVLAKMLFLGDLVAGVLAGLAALLILDNSVGDTPLFVVVVALLWTLVAFSIGLYRTDQLSSWASAVSEVPRGVVAIMLLTWPIFGLAALMGIKPAIGTAFVTVGAMAVLSAIARVVVRAVLHRNPALRQRTLILGSGVVAGQLVEKIKSNDQFGLDPVGLVDNVIHDIGTPDLPRFGGFADLAEIIEMQSIDRVIIAFSRVSHEELLEAIRACRDAGIAVDVIPRLFEFLDGIRSLDQIGGLPLLSISVPLLAPAMVAAKRMLDIVGSAALLLIFSPVMIATAIAIKVESRGPVFFRQPRAGRRNKSFNLIKFRSMYVDAEERKAELDALNEADDGVMFKIREDPRITKVGRFIRRFSIDELPQLFNVLRGEMSLVGPRPLIFSETAALEERWHLRRLELRPGITGPWQVYGRSDSPFQEMVRFDYQYVAGWSLARDIELLLATLPAVMSGRGAY